MTITLRIKRVYFDAIERGEKSVEYRDVKPYYDRLLTRPGITKLKLHYQQGPILLCDVVGIIKHRRPDTVEWRNDPDLGNFTHVYAIMLRNPRRIDRGR